MTLHASPLRGVLTSLMILVMLGLLLMGLVAYRQGVFEQRVIFVMVPDSAQDLHQGMKLTYRGFKLGQIERLSMGPDGRVSVELSVQQDRRSLVTEGTRVRVSKDKLITSELVLEPSSNASASPLKAGGTIELVREHVAADMARKVDQLLQQMDLLLAALADPAKGLPAVVRQTQATMALAQPVSHQAVQTMAELERLLTSLQPMSVQATQTLGELQQSLVQSRATLEQTHNLMQQLADPESGVAPALQEVRATSDKADRLIQTMDAAVQEVQSAPVYRWFVPRQQSPAP
jgi:ABC-type transporter Mla subunit MlaD